MKHIVYSIIFAFGLLFSLSLSSCVDQDDDDDPIVEEKIYFTGISRTDNLGVPIAAADTSDWHANDAWEAKEANLFLNGLNSGFPCATINTSYQIAAYPNPASNQIALSLSLDNVSATQFGYRLVDENFNVLLSNDNILSSNSLMLNLSGLPTDTLRLYYKFVHSGCEYRGHGDILIQ